MKILLAVDGSPFTKRMLAWLTTHEEWLSAPHEFTVLTVVPSIPPHAASMFSAEQLKSYYDDMAEKVFKPIRTFFVRQGLTAKYVTKIGPAAEIIAEAAQKGKYDLLILGSHGHGTLTNLVMGSVATKVLANCDTPTLLIR